MNTSITAAVAIPSTVIIFLPDVHSFFIVSKGIIADTYENTKNIYARLKNKLMLVIVLYDKNMQKPTSNTVVLLVISLRPLLANYLFNN